MQKKPIIIFFILTALAVLIFLLLNTYKKPDILIGFSGQLTGVNSDLGVQGRNGVILGAEDINSKGSIAGRKIKIITADDGNTPQQAKEADKKLIDSGVTAIIGHMTSDQTMAGLPVTEKAEVVLLSPTTSTPKLSGKKDLFFRVQGSSDISAEMFGKFADKNLGLKSAVILRDSSNEIFTKPYSKNFIKGFKKTGKALTDIYTFNSKSPDFINKINISAENNKTGILIIASGRNTAAILQKLKKTHPDAVFMTSSWGSTQALIRHAGRSAEGVYTAREGITDTSGKSYQDFSNRYKQRFGKKPSFAAVKGYQALKVLCKALEKTGGKKNGLPKALTELKNFKVLDETISLDKYGDPVLPVYIQQVENGNYSVVYRINTGEKND
ncbi:MAG: ABC transporter substrate-binding protein [Thermodesulfobacteriota bacterium]